MTHTQIILTTIKYYGKVAVDVWYEDESISDASVLLHNGNLYHRVNYYADGSESDHWGIELTEAQFASIRRLEDM